MDYNNSMANYLLVEILQKEIMSVVIGLLGIMALNLPINQQLLEEVV
jgi:hypothetical protein